MTRHLTHRRDSNHNKIITDFQRMGFIVEDIHNGGLADCMVKAYGRPFIFEIKAEGKRKKLTPAQIEKHLLWAGAIDVIETAEEGLRIIERKI